jgi:hypothetical protein
MATEHPPYSFCEPTGASGYGLWHIRKVTEAGQKVGGGIDTPSLCEHVKARDGWDLNVPMTLHHLTKNACKECLEAYQAQNS